MAPVEHVPISPPSFIGGDLFHLRLSSPKNLADVKYVLLCGTRSRAHAIAAQFTVNPIDLTDGDRYTLLCPHPAALVASHGIGVGSVDTLLHEVHKLLTSFEVTHYTLLRVGTCGGIGLSPGRLIVTRNAVNGLFEPAQRMCVLGHMRKFEGHLDATLREQLLSTAGRLFGNDVAVEGDTMCAETFYVAQCRADGAFAEGTDKERRDFLQTCLKRGVRNIEMESLPIAAFAKRARIPAAVVSVALVDRLVHNSPTEDEYVLRKHQDRAVRLVTHFVKEQINKV